MSQNYQNLDRAGGFDYQLYELPGLEQRTFRGPSIDLSAPYLAFVGAAQTFGRFAAMPFPTLLGDRLGIPVLNLGLGGAGPRRFEKGEYLELINRAEAVVVQVMSARSASNSLFDNSEGGGTYGRVRADQSTIRSEQFFSQLASSVNEHELAKIVKETRDDYTIHFIDLLQRISVPKILFWLSTRSPDLIDDFETFPRGVFGAYPQLVNRRMVEELSVFADAYVESVSSEGLPQTLWPSQDPVDGADVKAGVLENRYYPSPAMHLAAADALEAPCRRFTGRSVPDRRPRAARRFVVIGSARSGTNLLISLLREYQGCICAGELFNVDYLRDAVVPWPDLEEEDLPALLAVRARDPAAFWETLCGSAEARGHRAIGFKLLYQQIAAQMGLAEHLAADRGLAVIHIHRRNLLRRLVSELQARASGIWASTEKPAQPLPSVRLTMQEIVTSIEKAEEVRAWVSSTFAHHPVLTLIYEDLAGHPLRVASRAASFLGLPAAPGPKSVRHAKTGADSLSDAIVDYDLIRAKARRWASFFDD